MLGHVFISYAHEDRDYCEAIASALAQHGLEYWYDGGLRQGDRWDDTIEQHIASCSVFLVLGSRHSARWGSFVRNEVLNAQNRKKLIWVLRLDDTPFLQVEAIHGTNVFDRTLPDEAWFAELREAVREVQQSFLRPTCERSFGRGDRLRVAAPSPDGTWIAAVGQSHRVHLYAADGTDRVLGEGTDFDGTAAEALAVWSPDGRRLLTGVEDGGLRIWAMDGSESEPVRIPPVHPQDGRVRVGAWSPDGGSIAFVGRHGGARVLPLGGATATHTTGYQGRICALTWTPDGASVTTGHDDGRIWQFSATTGKPIREPVAGHSDRDTKRINCLAWSPQAPLLATGGDDGALMVWDWDLAEPESAPRRRELGHHAGPIWGMAWSSDGRYLATAGGDEQACLWDVLTGFRFSIPHPHQQVWSVAWQSDRRLVTVGEDGEARVWALWTGRPSDA